MNIQDYSKKLQQLKGQRDKIVSLLEKTEEEYKQLRRLQKQTEKAQTIIQLIAQQTQENLIYNIENIVTAALEAVFDEPYSFKVDFNIKRNKTEADLYFVKDGERYDPLNSSGYGAVDIASFALRIAAWSLSNKQNSNVFLLDEPFKHLSEDLQEKGMMMLSELAHKLNLQFILITHTKENDVMEYSDKVFRVQKKGKYSTVKILKGEKIE